MCVATLLCMSSIDLNFLLWCMQKGVVSTETIQPHKMVEMGHEYKDVSKYQQRGGEYAVVGKYAVVGT